MTNVVIVDAVRTPIGKRNGGLSTMHPAELLGTVQRAIVERSGIDPAEVGQVVGGCVSQVGEQAFNIARTAWLSRRPAAATSPPPPSTPSAARASRPPTSAPSLVGSGVVDVAVACGVEVDEPHPDRRRAAQEPRPRHPDPEDLLRAVRDDLAVRGRRAHRRQVGHHPRRHRRVRPRVSQQRAAQAWDEDRFAGQYIAVEAPDVDEDGKPTGTTHTVDRDEGLRETTLEKLASLKPVARENGVHTAGNSSQISDGAAAVLMMTEEKAAALGLTPRARIVDTCLVGVDPVLMLTGPIDATQRLLDRTGLSIDDIDVFEINEAFASVVLAWAEGARRRPRPDQPERRRDRPRSPARRHRRASCSPRRCTSSSAPAAGTASSRCAAVAASAPARSSSVSDPTLLPPDGGGESSDLGPEGACGRPRSASGVRSAEVRSGPVGSGRVS